MLLSDVKNYLRNHRRVLLVDLANRFDMEPDALRCMLQKWVSKGRLRRVSADTGCAQGCCKCDPATLEFYEWLE